jgi:hypothetical protein
MEEDFDLDDAALAALDAAEHAYFNGQQPPGPAPPRAPLEALPQNSAFSMVRSGLTQQPVPPPLWQPHPALKRAPNPTGVEANTAPLAAHPDPDAVAANLPPPVPADQAALSEWWYPTNMSVRAYQQSICKTALCHNTLVSIPTGMGKTLIAAVVMFNFHRWFPTGRLAFLAPTKPLIHQQIKAVRKTVGLPRSALAELTGALKPEERAKLWRGPCRLFFLTPQGAPARPRLTRASPACPPRTSPSLPPPPAPAPAAPPASHPHPHARPHTRRSPPPVPPLLPHAARPPSARPSARPLHDPHHTLCSAADAGERPRAVPLPRSRARVPGHR